MVHDVFPDQDIDVILDSQKVRVRVQRSDARGNPLSTLFARAMGIDQVDIGATAAAQAWPGVASDCILPFAIPDLWRVVEIVPPAERWPLIDDVYDDGSVDPNRADYYSSAADAAVGADYTGYGTNKIGFRIQLTTADPGEPPQPGWYYPIRLPGSKGGKDYGDSIKDCWEPEGEGVEYELGDFVDKEPGNMIGPTQQGFSDIFDDPMEQGITWWDPDGSPPLGGPLPGCPTRDGGATCVGPESRRVRPLVMFDPTEWPNIDNGAKPVPITAFGGVFLEEFNPPNEVWIRFMYYTGVVPAADPDLGSENLLRILRIVE